MKKHRKEEKGRAKHRRKTHAAQKDKTRKKLGNIRQVFDRTTWGGKENKDSGVGGVVMDKQPHTHRV